MKTAKTRREQLAEIRKDVMEDLKKIGDMTEVVDMLRELVREPDKAADYFYKWRDDRDCRIRLLQARIKNLVEQKLMSRDFAREIRAVLKEEF